MELELNVWERLSLMKVLGELKGNLGLLRKANNAMDVLELSEEEKGEVGFQTIVRPTGDVGYQWRDTDRAFAIEIPDREAAGLLKRAFGQYQGWSVSEYAQVEALAEKLGLSADAEESPTP